MLAQMIYGGVKLGQMAYNNLFGGSGGPPPIAYTMTAVPTEDLSDWLSEHRAVPYARFAEMLLEQGYSRAEAQECLDDGARYERQHRGCHVFCWNVRSA